MVDPLAVIYNEGYWRVCNVSPMYRCHFSEINIKRYSSKIRQDLASDAGISSGSLLQVSIENLPLLKYSHEDPNGLQITVTTCHKNRFQTTNKEVYVAILLGWGHGLPLSNQFITFLPYMLERGEKRVGETVKNSLQLMFDCNITPFCFTQVDLLRFLFEILENDTSKSTDSLSLGYKLSPQVNFSDKGTLTFDIGDIRTIWNRVKEYYDKHEQLFYAYNHIKTQINHAFQLDVTVLPLREIALPKAEVKSTGVVKMKTPEIINAVFTVLNKIYVVDWLQHELLLNNL
ncbi:uncharacterized protein LOC112057965 [Bicyclus anynana]|uniref:Centromere protein L n=1 Tax=Bicyclus anynana TaxID=110368 RepID=A0A6J1P913_BICAN|nr:uncharacterized protein LOC112057965 [Bicyclus anynana]